MNTPSPMTAAEIVTAYFIENRNRVLELAAFLDRLDRADAAAPADRDFRVRALLEAIAALSSPDAGRLVRIQMLLSDPTTEPRAVLDRKGAVGAHDPRRP
jgi:hypothetical protein